MRQPAHLATALLVGLSVSDDDGSAGIGQAGWTRAEVDLAFRALLVQAARSVHRQAAVTGWQIDGAGLAAQQAACLRDHVIQDRLE